MSEAKHCDRCKRMTYRDEPPCPGVEPCGHEVEIASLSRALERSQTAEADVFTLRASLAAVVEAAIPASLPVNGAHHPCPSCDRNRRNLRAALDAAQGGGDVER